jgi:hypothetical protein
MTYIEMKTLISINIKFSNKTYVQLGGVEHL